MEVHFYTAPCGAGKSYQAAKHLINHVGRYIVVRDRVEAINEYTSMVSTMANNAGVPLVIQSIVATRGTSVRHEVEAIPERFDVLNHVAVVITHKAMMMCDFSEFAGWHIIIDETPVVLDRQDIQTAQSVEFFERNYKLETTGKEG